MADRRIKIRSGELDVWMEVTEEEYQSYYRPWWQQKKREQRNRKAMKEKGYTEESYEAWRDNSADDMGIRDMDAESIEELLEKKMLRYLSMIFDAKWQNFCIRKHLCQRWYKHKVSYSEPGSNDFFSVSCSKVFISALHPLDDPMEPEPFKDSGHG